MQRLFLARLRLGMFDGPKHVPATLPSVLDSAEHRAIARRAAEESIMFLENEARTRGLPDLLHS